MRQYKRMELFQQMINLHPLVTIEMAMESTGASHATVRRDFDRLGEQGLAERVRGGIKRLSSGTMMPYIIREMRQAQQKEQIARRAVELLKPGQVIMVDGGTTTYHLARFLPAFALTVLTNSIRLASELDTLRRQNPALHPGLEIYLTGGQLYQDSGGLLVGRGAVQTLESYHADWSFLSVGGVNSEGLFNTNEVVVEVERTMIRRARQSVVLADHTKFGHSSMSHLCTLEEIDILITDRQPSPESLSTQMEYVNLCVAGETEN